MITDPRAIKFVNETIRPMAEKLRAFKVEVDSAAITYTGISSLFPNDPDEMLDDGRENEGVSRLNGRDIVLIIGQIAAIRDQLDGEGVVNIIAKPCVRALTAS